MGSPGVESVAGAILGTAANLLFGTGGLAAIGATGGLALVAGGSYLAYNYFYPS